MLTTKEQKIKFLTTLGYNIDNIEYTLQSKSDEKLNKDIEILLAYEEVTTEIIDFKRKKYIFVEPSLEITKYEISSVFEKEFDKYLFEMVHHHASMRVNFCSKTK